MEHRVSAVWQGKTRKWLCAVVALSVATVALLVSTLVFSMRPKRSYLGELESVYQRNFNDFTQNLSTLEVRLSKLSVADDMDLQRELADGIWRQTGELTVYLASLPLDHHAVEKTYKLLNQLGDYVYALNKKLSQGVALTAQESKNAQTLYALAKEINASLREFRAQNPTYRFTEHLDGLGASEVGDALVGEGTAEYPHLIYDGPFSDSLTEKDYSWLSRFAETDEKQAVAWAQERFAGEPTYLGTTQTEPKCHIVGIGDAYLQVTVRGLLPMTVAVNTPSQAPELQMSEAVAVAKAWAESAYGVTFEETWWIAAEGVATVNLAIRDGGVTYYPELVKIKVDLATGKVVGAEGLNYISNRGSHAGYTATRTVAEARAVLKSLPDAEYTRLALIPKGTRTILCREFTCEQDGYTYIVYVGANDLREYDVLRVVDTDQGEMLA